MTEYSKLIQQRRELAIKELKLGKAYNLNLSQKNLWIEKIKEYNKEHRTKFPKDKFIELTFTGKNGEERKVWEINVLEFKEELVSHDEIIIKMKELELERKNKEIKEEEIDPLAA